MRKKLKKDFIRNITWYSFIIVPIVTLLLLHYKPLVSTLYYSFTNMEAFGTDYDIIGFSNYLKLFRNPLFLNSLKNTFLLAAYGLLTIPVGFLLANAINSLGRTKLQSFFRVLFYMPNIITGVSVVVIFQYVLKGNGGLLNEFLSWITGMDITIGWISDFRFSHIGATILWTWMNLGYTMLLSLANLQSIPLELYEVASIDGATSWKRLIYITIPLMRSCFAFLFITGMINGLSRFTDLFIVGGNSPAGSPNNSLQSILMYIYQYSFEWPNTGIASAGSVVLFIIVMCFTLINIKLSGFLKEDE